MNKEQELAFTYAKEGRSFFLTGKAGVGKSYLIEKIRDELEASHKTVAVTAMTGCAAVLLGTKAKTLHSWAGIGLGRDPPVVLIQTIRKIDKYRTRWRMVDTLILDEISMMTPDLLETLDTIARAIRFNKSHLPMGGIQCIFVGDFYQLPPVTRDGELKFVFESPKWKEIFPNTVELTQIIRQDNPVFHRILHEARDGTLSEESLVILREKQGLPWQKLEIRPTLLFSRKFEVDHVNAVNIKKLTSQRQLYTATTVLDPTCTLKNDKIQQAIQKCDRDAPYSSELILAVGAQVMLLKNLNTEAGLVNGSRGVVVGFTETSFPLPVVKFKNGLQHTVDYATWDCFDLEGVKRKQIPLVLAYAITIHKAQGATLDCVLIDVGASTFEYGQAYVALSRLRNLDSLYIWNLEPEAFRTHTKVKEFYESLRT